jgi:RNA polymerase sigma factor (sigma-70 family)
MAGADRPWTFLTERLRRFVRVFVESREDAEDVIQEAYLRVLRYSAEHEVEHPERLLFSTARNLAVDARRRRKVRERTEARYALVEACAFDWPASDEVEEARQRLQRVEAAVMNLSPRCRAVFFMHRLEGMSYSQIATHCGISVSAVEKHIARACLHIDAKVHGDDSSD